ncbi:MAG: tetratricopeptide repeat protein [Gemmatimonadetes bacterium]|nr:tetratricopeptide repeat protein [Gemmatimonadota bacterium]
MIARLPSPVRALCGLALYLCSAWAACERRDETPAGEEEVRPVVLPSLESLPPSVREQLSSQHARLQDLLHQPRRKRRALGDAYGVMGQLLLAYDLSDAAEPALLNAVDLLPKDPRWSYYLAYLYKHRGDFEAAARRFERHVALRREDAPARIHLAEAYIHLGRRADAKRGLEEATRIDPRSAAAHFLLAQIADEPSEAVAHYETVLRLQPGASVVHYPLALAYRKLGDLERSREHLARRGDAYIAVRDPLLEELEALRLGPEAKMLQGSRFLEERRYRDAAVAFEAVVAEDSANALGYLNLGVAYARLGNRESASRAFTQAVRLDPSNSRAHYNLGLLLRQRGEDRNALEHFRAAVGTDSSNRSAHFALSDLLSRKGRCREAIPHFEKFLAADPGHVEARIHQAICHVQLGEYARARKLLEAGYAASPQEPGLQDAMIRVLAASRDASVRDGRRALEMAERLVSSVRRPETLETLAMAYAQVGRFREAIEIQEQAIRAAQEEGLTATLDFLRSNLRRYQEGKPSRSPWSPTVLTGGATPETPPD